MLYLFSSRFISATHLATFLSIKRKEALIMFVTSGLGLVRFCKRASVFVTATVIYRLPFIPCHQENEPSEFCSFFRLENVDVNLFCNWFSSKKRTSCCFCSLSFLASITQGVSSSVKDFSSWFFSKADIIDVSLPVSFFHCSIVCLIDGEVLMICLPKRFA